MDEIGVGIVGYGFIGRIHALSYVSVPWTYPGAPRTRLVAASTATESSADRARKEGAFDLVTTDYRQLLERDDIQAVSVCTPNDVHREVVLAALEAGKHVYCDKPLALNLEQATEVAERARHSAGVHQMTFNYRFVPAIRRAHQMITEGFLGRLIHFRAAYLHSGYTDPNRPLSWRLDRERSGGGAVMDLGVHVVDLVRKLLGEFRAVAALERTFIRQRPLPDGTGMGQVRVDDLTLAQVELAGGAVGTLEFSRLATGTEDDLRLEIHGDRGALRFSLMEPDWLYAYDARESDAPLGGERGWKQIAVLGRYPEKGALPGAKSTQGWLRFHVASAYDFLLNVEQGHLSDYSPSFEDGREAQRVVAALQQSAADGGAWCPVAEVR
ncbi:MAG: Gfo/Idh/MocA family protein [Anaerolineae bacterium]|jgi:predicted dehydrogenase